MHAVDGCFYNILVALVIFTCTCSKSSYLAIQKYVFLVVVVVELGNNLINAILIYDFHQSLMESINLRDMILSYDSINQRFHHYISPNYD